MEMCCKISYTWKSMNENKIWLNQYREILFCLKDENLEKPKTDQKKHTFKVKK